MYRDSSLIPCDTQLSVTQSPERAAQEEQVVARAQLKLLERAAYASTVRLPEHLDAHPIPHSGGDTTLEMSRCAAPILQRFDGYCATRSLRRSERQRTPRSTSTSRVHFRASHEMSSACSTQLHACSKTVQQSPRALCLSEVIYAKVRSTPGISNTARVNVTRVCPGTRAPLQHHPSAHNPVKYTS